jgi:hypothetical protein
VNQTRRCRKCLGGRDCCKQCLVYVPEQPQECHCCYEQPKDMSYDVTPVYDGTSGLQWYFSYPEDQPWVTMNRDVKMDPLLKEIVQVHKGGKLPKEDRRVRPLGWERCMTVECDLHGPRGETARVYINLHSFLMNPEWKKDPKIAYVEQWLPTHLDHRGPVFFTTQAIPHIVAHRSDVLSWPGRPRVSRGLNDHVTTTTVRIEEVHETYQEAENRALDRLTDREEAYLTRAMKRRRVVQAEHTEETDEMVIRNLLRGEC